MNTRTIATAYRLSEWAQKLQERRATGESIDAFCARTGASRHSYFYWQRKVREAACRELLPELDGNKIQEMVPSGWAVCTAKDAPQEAQGVIVEIGKFRVLAEAGTNSKTLEAVFRVLVDLC